MMGSSHAAQPEDLDVPDATFVRPDLTTFAGLDELGLEVVGQRLEPDRARCWRAGSSSPTTGAAAADVLVQRATR